MMTIDRFSFGQRVLALVIGLVGLLLALIGNIELTRAESTPVVLETAPVDPRSMFQGDYVTLSYKISRVDTAQSFSNGQTIYVVLRQNIESGLWEVARASATLPELSADEKVIRGVSEGYNRVRYGIEAFFVPEDQGHWIERVTDRSRITVRVLLSADGTASMDALLVDGQEVFAQAGLGR